MIQRIQTVYLLLAAVLVSMMNLFPVAVFFAGPDDVIVFRSYGIFYQESADKLLPSLPFLVLISVIILLFLVAIFLYRKRILQSRICRLNILLLIGSAGLITYYIILVQNRVDTSGMAVKIAALFPLIAAVLTWLAIRGILRDEALVRSADKIRSR